eukprot:CAMPEP_0168314112 /NCGR_PEP_ID=MMETSP0210-20121227/6443_1 /TAXON_ID=40633 /ORGANISM="Condylostoma magnum, Strain COL2" /LENGTH=47 /DNA_ID= /DNA_START= /DNA_END= /DNA_ORIENTATION=
MISYVQNANQMINEGSMTKDALNEIVNEFNEHDTWLKKAVYPIQYRS